MQTGAVTLRSEEGLSEAKGMEGYGLARDEDVHDLRQMPPDCGGVLIQEELGLTGRPPKQAESSSRVTINASVNSSQSVPRPNSFSDKRTGHSSLQHGHQLGSHTNPTYAKLRCLLL